MRRSRGLAIALNILAGLLAVRLSVTGVIGLAFMLNASQLNFVYTVGFLATLAAGPLWYFYVTRRKTPWLLWLLPLVEFAFGTYISVTECGSHCAEARTFTNVLLNVNSYLVLGSLLLAALIQGYLRLMPPREGEDPPAPGVAQLA